MILKPEQKFYLYRIVLAFASGVCLSSAFAPANQPLYAMAALTVIFYLIAHTPSLKQTALWAVAFGFGWFVSGINWVYYSMYHYGYMPLEWTYVTTSLFSLALSIFPIAAFVLANAVTKDPIMRMAATIPAAFTITEWLRGWLLTGFPWLNPAYAMVDSPLAGIAPLMGSFGVLLGTAWICGLIGAIWAARGQLVNRLSMGIIGVCVFMLGLTGQSVPWTNPTGEVSVRLVQPNLEPRLLQQSLSERFDEVYYYMDQVSVEKAPIDVLMLPESVYPTSVQRFPHQEVARLQAWTQNEKKTVIFNAFWEPTAGDVRNAAVALNPEGTLQHYEKRHLVPFGEFVPFGFQWFVDAMRIPMSDQEKGSDTQPLMTIAGHPASVNICYENLFGEEWIRAWDNGQDPQWLINLSNLKWFGPSKAAEQHFQVSRMRAMEMARPVLSVTNSGVTGLIDEKGKVVARLETDIESFLDVKVQTVTGAATPYVRFGNWVALICAFMMFAVGFLAPRVLNRLQKA